MVTSTTGPRFFSIYLTNVNQMWCLIFEFRQVWDNWNMVELNKIKKKTRMDVKTCKSDEPALFVIRYPKWKFQFLGCTKKHDIQRGIERMWLKKEIISPEQQPPHKPAMTCQMQEYISILILRRQAKEAKPIAPIQLP